MGRPAISTLVTEAEYLALPETSERVELVDGEVIVAPSPSDRHQELALHVASHLLAWARAHPPASVRIAPLDVRFASGRILQPDVFVVLDGIPADARTPLDLVPDLVVEILSGSNRAYDRLTKRTLYADAGVPEYWIVDPMLRQVEIHRPAVQAVAATDHLSSALLPGFELDLSRLW